MVFAGATRPLMPLIGRSGTQPSPIARTITCSTSALLSVVPRLAAGWSHSGGRRHREGPAGVPSQSGLRYVSVRAAALRPRSETRPSSRSSSPESANLLSRTWFWRSVSSHVRWDRRRPGGITCGVGHVHWACPTPLCQWTTLSPRVLYRKAIRPITARASMIVGGHWKLPVHTLAT